MLPVLGPSTVRDTAALPADIGADIWKYKRPENWRNIGAAVRVVDKRATLLDAGNLLEDAALDRYEFIRDGYMQRRQSQVYDGNVPRQADGADDPGVGAGVAHQSAAAQRVVRVVERAERVGVGGDDVLAQRVVGHGGGDDHRSCRYRQNRTKQAHQLPP
jgi:hypothetical protein